ncbi:hypothetical protein [uncultured Paraglaciecola sp.]|uniref:hypothetical protein n=1 Tax=uncultured Paraglaciecola sp. TaxID=1765024 RepID=UPI00261A4E5E|nr:hypothetical protein [uncultured Paraglaciecola sp.]
MSNPVKKLKKNFKKIVKAVIVAAVVFAAFPAIAGVVSAGGAAAGASTVGSLTAAQGITGSIAGAGLVGGSAGAAAGGGLISAMGSGLASVGGAIKGASPLVKMGLIQTGGQMLQGAMTPEPQTAAEMEAERLAVYHNQPTQARSFSAQPTGFIAPQVGVQSQFAQPQQAQTPRAVARVNPATGLFERA